MQTSSLDSLESRQTKMLERQNRKQAYFYSVVITIITAVTKIKMYTQNS